MEPVITIDGPSGAGKSSAARSIAELGGWRYLDTGSLYRALTYGLLHIGLDQVTNHRTEWICSKMLEIEIEVVASANNPKIFCDGIEVGNEIRTDLVIQNVSEISALECVRSRLLVLQRALINGGGIVVEGRDIGSKVWPEADVKFFLTADLAARAKRRHAEISDGQGLDSVEGSMAMRDAVDSTRPVSPLTVPGGSIYLDATALSLGQVVDRMWSEINRKLMP
ncbi:MAG TPA: (d)CMP kinase [Candidatus Nanopelagicaceae bacterium]|nr:(d)CMP kinase [Candidatus Nanopelagicaceae bacterium]